MATETESHLEQLRQQREALQLRIDIEGDRLKLQEMTQAQEHSHYLQEAAGDLIDRREWLRDDNSFGYTQFVFPPSSVSDREDGKFRPIFETEQELQMIRGPVRLVCSTFGSAINIKTNLNNYTIGEGFTHEAKCKKGQEEECPAELPRAVQYVLDTFFEDNDWVSDLETEIHEKTREDGECAITIRPFSGWRCEVELLEPDQITEPKNPSDIEEFLGCRDQYVSSWSFGVHTRRNKPARPLGYAVIHDAQGYDWDYYTSGDVPTALRLRSGVLELLKRNVPRNVKRGISDFYPIIGRLRNSEKLGNNLEVASAVQAAIAYIREHNPTATQDQVAAVRAAAATARIQRQSGNGGIKTVNQQMFQPGSIIDTNGSKYLYGPAGQSSAPNFVLTIQSALRYCGSRWAMPEYMISSDASNNNFASILVAGSPFVKAREHDQRWFMSRFMRVDWHVIRFAWELGAFAKFNIPWDKLQQFIEIDIQPPDITITDELKDAQKKEIEKRNGVLSGKTWIKESGRNPETEEANIQAEGGHVGQTEGGQGAGSPFGGQGMPGQAGQMPGGAGGFGDQQQQQQGGEFRDANRLQWKRYMANIQDVLQKVAQKQMTPLLAAEALGSFGVDAGRIQRLLADVMDDGRLTPENARDIAEDAATMAIGNMLLEDSAADPASHLRPPNRVLFDSAEAWQKATKIWLNQMLPLTSSAARAKRFGIKPPTIIENCGDGAGGFQPGNTCAKEDGGGGSGGGVSTSSRASRDTKETGGSRGGNAAKSPASGKAPGMLLSRLKNDGGFTYDVVHDDSPTKGFVVSTSLSNERIFKPGEIDESTVQKYMDDHDAIFKSDPTARLGGWLNEKTGEIYLDVSHVIDDKEQALNLAKAHKQEAIYDISAGQTVFVNQGDAQRRADAVSVPTGDNGQGSGGDPAKDAGSGGGKEQAGAVTTPGGVPHPKSISDLPRFVQEVQATDLYKRVLADQARIANVAPGGRVEAFTQSKYSDGKGNYSAERTKIHDAIVDRLLNPNAAAKPGQKPVALLTLGPPGAGKTSIIGSEAKRLGREFTTINSDDVKSMLPGYEGWNGGIFHNESNDVAIGKLGAKAVELRHNIVFDSTGSSIEWMQKIAEGYAKAGYDVHLVNVALPAHKSAARAWERFAANAYSKDKSKEPGRFVPIDFVEYVDGRPGRTYQELKKQPFIKEYTSVSTDVPMGAKPVELERGSNKSDG